MQLTGLWHGVISAKNHGASTYNEDKMMMIEKCEEKIESLEKMLRD